MEMTGSTTGRQVGRVFGTVVVLVVLGAFVAGVFGTIQTGNVGVRTTLGKVSGDEVEPGVFMKWPVISRVREYSGKETNLELNDLTPKAKDNLSLRDMDITVFYRIKSDQIAELEVKYAGQTSRGDDGVLFPAMEVVRKVARNAAYEEVAKIDSLLMHTKRDDLAAAMRANIQNELEQNDKGIFQVTRVVVRAVITDASIEQSIQQAVANQKKLEAMQVQTEIAKKEAEVRVTEAEGIAKANRIIANSLTREYLQHEANQALMEFAKRGNASTVVLPAGLNVAPLINVTPPAGGAPAKPPKQ